jgi:hypothetical protein
MNEKTMILLYSNYSSSCKKLINLIKDIPIVNDLNYLCIDNEDIRKMILSSKEIVVEYVPCLLIVHTYEGKIEKYDNNYVFDWFNNLITEWQNYQNEKIEEKKQQQEVVEEKKENNKPKRTSLLETSDNDDTPYEEIVRPPVMIRSGTGNYDIEHNIPHADDNQHSTIKTDKGGGVLAMAEALQRERERDVSSGSRNNNF